MGTFNRWVTFFSDPTKKTNLILMNNSIGNPEMRVGQG